MKKLLTLFVLICPLLALAQQTRQITGQVLDRADGTPLVGATVFIAPEETQAKNYNPQGTIVYEQGRFAFKLPVSVKKVVVSYLGYEAQTIDISGKSNFTIYLSATESKMDAVVVTGYQRIEKRKLTSSIANVKMADIARDGVASVDEMLSGSIAGLTSTPTTGAPGGASKVKIRCGCWTACRSKATTSPRTGRRKRTSIISTTCRSRVSTRPISRTSPC